MAASKKEANGNVSVQAVKTPQAEFSKEQILASAKYNNRRDLVDALLSDSEKYTLEAVVKRIDEFMKGKVK